MSPPAIGNDHVGEVRPAPAVAAERAPDRHPPHTHLVWPAYRFYWGVLDTSGLPREARRERRGVGGRAYLLEPLLPVPAESVHAVYAPVGDGRVLACAAPVEAIESLDDDTLSLVPADLPDVVGEVEVDPRRLNLLVGAYEPRRVRQLRDVWRASAVAVVAACACLAAVGLLKRAEIHEQAAADAAAALRALYDDVLPARLAGSSQNPALLLSAEVERLRRTRSDAAPAHAAGDAAPVLAELLERWPTEVMLRTESLTVTGNEVTLTGLVDSADQVEPVRTALARVGGWRVSLPRTETTGEGDVRITLRLNEEANK